MDFYPEIGILNTLRVHVMTETKAHKDAFNKYYLMGADRSLRELALHLNCTARAVKTWSSEFSWQERIALRDIEISRKLAEKVDDEVVNTKADYRKQIKEGLVNIKREKGYLTSAFGTAKKKLEDEKDKTLDVTSIRDLTDLSKAIQGIYRGEQALMKLDLLMMGEADSHTQVSGKGIVFRFGGKLSEEDL